MKESLSTKVLNYLKEKGDFVNGGEVERLALELGYKSSNASRRLREMKNAGLVIKELRRYNKVRSVWYKAVTKNAATSQINDTAGVPRVYLEGRERLSNQLKFF